MNSMTTSVFPKVKTVLGTGTIVSVKRNILSIECEGEIHQFLAFRCTKNHYEFVGNGRRTVFTKGKLYPVLFQEVFSEFTTLTDTNEEYILHSPMNHYGTWLEEHFCLWGGGDIHEAVVNKIAPMPEDYLMEN